MSPSLAAENDELIELPEDRFVYNAEVPTLERMASNRVALAIWYGYISRSDWVLPKMKKIVTCFNHLYYSHSIRQFETTRKRILTDTQKLPDVLQTPRSVEEIIKISLKNVVSECWTWLEHLRDMFDGHLIQYRIRYIDPNWWMWMANGDMDFQKTCKAMLMSGKLTKMQIFVVSSRHCLEDQIEAASVDLPLLESVESMGYYDEIMLFYWTAITKDKLSNFPRTCEYYNRVILMMIRAMKCNYNFTIEYFWSRLDETARESAMIEWIKNCCDEICWNFIERFLSSMSCTQQRRLVSQMPVLIMRKFFIYSRSSKSVLWCWRQIKGTINEQEFIELFDAMFLKAKSIEEKSYLMIELWNTALDHHKKYTAEKLAEKIWSWRIIHCPVTLLKFCYGVFRLVPKLALKTLILKNTQFLTKSHPHDINFCDKILDLCSSDPEDRLKLKRSIFMSNEVEDMLASRIMEANFENLCIINLEWYFAEDLDRATAFKKKVLQKMHSRHPRFLTVILGVLTNANAWKFFSKFIDETYPKDEPSALKEKRWWILLLEKKRRSGYFKNQIIAKNDEVMKIAETVFANDELERLKQSFRDCM